MSGSIPQEKDKMKRRQIILWFLAWYFLGVAAYAQENLSPGDSIHIWVKGEPDLTIDRTINPDGTISYPLIGSVSISGMKTHEAAKLIASMLDDGYLRQPLVQINLIAKTSQLPSPKQSPTIPRRISSTSDAVVGEPLDTEDPSTGATTTTTSKKSPETKKIPTVLQIEIIDGKTGAGISGAALLLGGKIYQSNRLGQMVIENPSGRIILLADGYKIQQGPIERFLKIGSPNKVILDPIEYLKVVSFKVVDASTQLPLADVEIRLNSMRVKTNSQGVFRINQIKTEFGEIQLSKRGYKTIKKVIDFKGPSEQVLVMVHNE